MNPVAFALIIVLGALIGAVAFFVFMYIKRKQRKHMITAIIIAVVAVLLNLALQNGVIDSLFR
jgi:hypothetical protein